MLNKFLNVVDHVLNDIVWWNMWNWIHTFGIMYELMFVCVLSIDAYLITEISELHSWSKSYRLRYQVVRSG